MNNLSYLLNSLISEDPHRVLQFFFTISEKNSKFTKINETLRISDMFLYQDFISHSTIPRVIKLKILRVSFLNFSSNTVSLNS